MDGRDYIEDTREIEGVGVQNSIAIVDKMTDHRPMDRTGQVSCSNFCLSLFYEEYVRPVNIGVWFLRPLNLEQWRLYKHTNRHHH